MADPPDELRSNEVDDHAKGRSVVIRHAVLAYLERNRHACDTAHGICTWWLQDLDADETEVRSALEDMVQQGLMQSIRLSGDVVVYRAAADGRDG